jgi:hypothetical protein
VIRWLIAIILILMIFGGLHRWRKDLPGKLPGDFWFGFRQEFFRRSAAVLLSDRVGSGQLF